MNVFIIFTGSFLVTLASTFSVEDESRLQENLLTGYNANVRPADVAYVLIDMNMRNLLSLDIVEQTLAISGSFVVRWQDNRLSWNMSQNGNVSRVFFRSDQIWRPTLVLQNSAIGIEVIGDNSNQKSIPLMVNFDGGVFWLAPAYFISYCSVDVTQFPFDTQTCELKISGWLYSTDYVQLLTTLDTITLVEFEENGEYEIIRTYSRVDRMPLYFSYIETLVFGIELRRKYSYYLVNVVLPVLFMQLLGLVVFLVPSESGEKLTFSLTMLLSLTVMMTLVAEKIPTTSQQIPTLSIYMLGGAVISSLEVIMTVVILYFKHYRKTSVVMGKKMRSIVYIIGLLTCKKRNKLDSEKDKTVVKPAKHNNCVTTVEIITTEDILNEQQKVDIAKVEREIFDENDSVNEFTYTPEEFAAILDNISLLCFTIMTIVLTFVMIVMVL